MCSFVGYDGYPEHDLPVLRVSNLAEECGEVEALLPIGLFNHKALSASLAEAESSSRH